MCHKGSLLGPLPFTIYVADIILLVDNNGLTTLLYADDTQIYRACSPSATDSFLLNVTECIDAIDVWWRSTRLQLNAGQMEFSMVHDGSPEGLSASSRSNELLYADSPVVQRA